MFLRNIKMAPNYLDLLKKYLGWHLFVNMGSAKNLDLIQLQFVTFNYKSKATL